MSIVNVLYETIDLNLGSHQDRTKKPIFWDSHPENLPREGEFFSGRIRIWTTPDFSETDAQFVVEQTYKHVKGLLEISYQIHDSYIDFDFQIREQKEMGEN